MGIAKKVNWKSIFIFLFLVIFPFGQIMRFNLSVGEFKIPFQPIDIIVGCGAFYAFIFYKSKPTYFRYIENFLFVIAFSYLASLFFFKKEAFYGLFYLFRITAFSFFLIYVWNYAKNTLGGTKLLENSLLAVSTVSAIFGWIQYFTIPDLKPLYYIGWDMHLYRLAGTFLDPTFLGLIIVFGLIISLNYYIDTKKKKFLIILLFLLISLAFTYARATYLAFFVSLVVLGLAKKTLRKFMYLIIGLGMLAMILPTAKNHSIILTRTFSISARFTNYRQALEVFNNNPILGVGYNNMCAARNRYVGFEKYSSHACSGADSSLLLILATTGIIGLLVFLDMGIKMILETTKSKKWYVVIAAGSALIVHSFFSNSLFFPWIMGYMAILFVIFTTEKSSA